MCKRYENPEVIVELKQLLSQYPQVLCLTRFDCDFDQKDYGSQLGVYFEDGTTPEVSVPIMETIEEFYNSAYTTQASCNYTYAHCTSCKPNRSKEKYIFERGVEF